MAGGILVNQIRVTMVDSTYKSLSRNEYPVTELANWES